MVVGGVSGAGKSTLARALARLLDAPHVEVDAHFHRAGWVSATPEEFTASMDAATAGDRWVVDASYSAVQDLVWSRATTFVWLDYPRGVATWRTIRRTARRIATREELWNGNREDWRTILDAEHPIRWSWSQHVPRREALTARTTDPRWAHVDVIRLRSPAETARWLHRVASAT